VAVAFHPAPRCRPEWRADVCSIPAGLARIRPEPDGEPVRIAVGVFLFDVVGIYELEESFRVDFALSLRWRDPRLSAAARGGSLEDCRFGLADIWHPVVHPINQRGLTRERERDADIADDGTVQFSERINGELSSFLELGDFPFDAQRLKIQLASFEYGPEDVVFVVDEARTGRLEGMFLAGWEILENSSDADVPPASGAARHHSRLDHTILVARRPSSYVSKFIVPLCLIVLMASSVFWLDPQSFGPQIGVATASVFSLIAFLLGLRQMLPRVAYLTRMDELVLSATVLVFLALGEVIITSRLAQGERVDLARRIDRHARWVYPAAFVLLLLITLIV
jgi:hypothetical protein